MDNIRHLTLPTKDREITANYVQVLRNQVYILAEDNLDLPEGSVLVWNRKQGLYAVWERGLFMAIRGMGHAQAGYGMLTDDQDEFGEMKYLTISVATLRGLLRQIWMYDHLGKNQQEQFHQLCADLAEQFAMVKDEDKQTARDRIAQVTTPLDILGRRNLPSKAPLIWSSVDKIERRQVHIRFISSWVDARQFAMLAKLDECFALVYRVEEEMKGLIGQQVDMSLPLIRQSMINQIGPLIERLSEVHTLPFRHVFRRSATDLNSARILLRKASEQSRDLRIIDYFQRCQDAMTLYLIRRTIEDVLWPFSREMSRRLHDPEILDVYRQDILRLVDFVCENRDLDVQFRNPIMNKVCRQLMAAKLAMGQNVLSADFKTAKHALVKACEPF